MTIKGYIEVNTVKGFFKVDGNVTSLWDINMDKNIYITIQYSLMGLTSGV